MEKEGVGEFSFYGVRNYEEEGNIGGCYVHVPNVKEVYQELRASVKAYYGKIPVKGTPRMSRLNQTAEDWRVNVTDASGNTIIIGEQIGDSTTLMNAEEERVKKLTSPFEKSYAQAYRFAYSKEDFLAARNTLEVAFRKSNSSISNEILFKARVLQAEVYASLEQNKQAEKSIQEADQVALTLEEKDAVKETSERLDEIRKEIN